MDFFQIGTKDGRGGVTEIYPDFTVGRSKDLMIRGRAFYAIWDPEKDDGRGMWSTDEYDVQRLVDEALRKYAEEQKAAGVSCNVKYLRSFTTNGWKQFRTFMSNVSDNSHQLDETLTFANTEVKKSDYVSRRLPYSLAPGDHSAWDELVSTLYAEDERAKIEWAIGSIVSGDSKKLQKFLVFYGPGGTGKSTILNVIQKLFDGYVATFEAKALTGNSNSFSTEVFKTNPLVAIQHDGDLSKIEDNTKLNSIISHEPMTINEKYKPGYTFKIQAILLMGTNKPVKISDAKSGIIRRLIDVHPTGKRFHPNHYHTLISQIDFELGAIAQHCLDVYRTMGKNYYNTYRPLEMMLQTDVFFNFIEAYWDVFKAQDGATLKQAYALYKEYCNDTGIEWVLPQYKFREEFRNYFDDFKDRATVGGNIVRSYYSGFNAQPFKVTVDANAKTFSLVMDETISLLDVLLADQPAQYGKTDETPEKYWSNDPRLIGGELREPKPHQVVKTKLSDLDTSKLHFVKPPENHIMIDFDLKDKNGAKSLERNLEAASTWPATYAERSKSGSGVHLHYIYAGDPHDLANVYDEGIEVKVFIGNASIRRKLTKCNNIPVATISSGLPFKEKKVLVTETLKSEKGLRELIARNLRKEIHPGTKPSIDFIHKILEDAYASGMPYDVTDLRPALLAFANNSTNQPLLCLKMVQKMRYKSDDPIDANASPVLERQVKDAPIAFYDVEVFPNLFVVCWKYEDSPTVVRMINPTPQEMEQLFRLKLVGFNNRRYDNHICYARYLGYTNEQLHILSQKIINGTGNNTLFGEAFNLSYSDVYDFSSVKASLKKFEIELGLNHMELDLPWDEPVAEELWNKVAEYCANDVLATEGVFKARKQDFVARQILAELSGLAVNDTTYKHTAKIIFGNDPHPQRSFVYTDLSKEFPGYVYDQGQSTYRGEATGEGGYVYAEPGMYEDVALLDVASMHPTSIIRLNLFGDEYTRKFAELTQARLAIKHKDYDSAGNLLDGRLRPYLGDLTDSTALADALKIIINTVYGLTSAKFDNPFRDLRNKDNIVAKRGALFMIDLKHAIQEQGFIVAHIKTDSVKIPNATPEIIDFVINFGDKYGYTFEYRPDKDHYDKFCLVNDAVYVARKDDCITPEWTTVGAQFQHPYVFKRLFNRDAEIEFDDLCETKQVTKGAIYLDFDATKPMAMVDPHTSMHFVGRTGRFVPVREEYGGGILYRIKDGKAYAVSGTKGYLWVEAKTADTLPPEAIDMSYFEALANDARDTIDYFGSFEEFVG